MKAKVFLSCDQNKNSDELAIAEKIAQRIDKLGFHCYMAVAEQSLRSLRENIFAQLESSDYLIFVDFKRKKLKDNEGKTVFRGSLFSHQELAIASFLEIPVLPLQESGLNPLDGMLGAMQLNAIPFRDRKLLPNVVGDLINQKLGSGEWQTDTRNTLSLAVANPLFTDAILNTGGTRRFYHIAVCNNHHRKAALYCYVYLDTIVNLRTNKLARPKTVEFKWSGTLLPDVRIGPKTFREFDGVDFILTTPVQPRFWPLTDSPDYWPRLDGSGKYRLSYSVVSQNFGTTTCDFILEYGQTPGSVVFFKA